jgi:hypothetical protein
MEVFQPIKKNQVKETEAAQITTLVQNSLNLFSFNHSIQHNEQLVKQTISTKTTINNNTPVNVVRKYLLRNCSNGGSHQWDEPPEELFESLLQMSVLWNAFISQPKFNLKFINFSLFERYQKIIWNMHFVHSQTNIGSSGSLSLQQITIEELFEASIHRFFFDMLGRQTRNTEFQHQALLTCFIQYILHYDKEQFTLVHKQLLWKAITLLNTSDHSSSQLFFNKLFDQVHCDRKAITSFILQLISLHWDGDHSDQFTSIQFFVWCLTG